MLISSTVSQPYIISGVRKDEGWCFVLVIDNPSIRTVQKPMLEEDRLESLPDVRVFLLDPEQSEDITILGGNIMVLARIVIILAVVGEIEFGLGMNL